MSGSLVSVIVRTKDRPGLLREALESLAAQSHRPLQVIVVNDGGEDVAEILEPFAETFEGLEYLRHEENRGRAAAANTGLAAVEGDFFAFLDDDDLLLPHHFSFLLERAEPGLVVYSRARYEIFDSDGRPKASCHPWEGPFRREELLLGNFIPLHTLLFPRSVLEKTGPFDEELELFEDWDFLLRASEVFPFEAFDEVTVVYRFFEGEGIARGFHASEAEKESFLRVLAKHRPQPHEALYLAYLKRVSLRWELSLLQEEHLALEGRLRSKEEDLTRLREDLSAAREALARAEAGLSELSRRLEVLEREREELAARLRLMEETLGWQLLERLRAVLGRLAPEGTRRQAFLSLTKTLLRLSLTGAGRARLRAEVPKFFRYLRRFGPRAALSRALAKSRTLALPPQTSPSRGKVLAALLEGESPPLPELDRPVTVVVPVFNAFEKLKRCLSSVLAHTDLSRVHLLVIDDASTDPRVAPFLEELAREHGFEFRRHRENRGFVATVNEAVRDRRGHLVILNSDTEVPPRWLERLMAPIVEDPFRVASTTPFSNRATICSFPEFCAENDLPPGLGPEELDALFALLWGRVDPIEIPTGVGFCMALSDEALRAVGPFDEETFGRGYGEENDWCLRAEKAGFRNLHVPWLFVAHHHGASFGPERNRLAEEGVRRVEAKHPGYLARIHAFIAKDPAREIRETIELLVDFRTAPSPRLLCLSHGLGGGAELFLEDIKNLLHQNSFTLLRLSAKNFILEHRGREFSLPADPARFPRLAELLSPDVVFVNHLAGVRNMEETLSVLRRLPFRRVYFLHDYLPLCPSYTLVDESLRFCGLPEDPARCRRCLSGDLSRRGMIAGVARERDVVSWRRMWGEFLRETVVVAPSASAAALLRRVYPEIEPVILPHCCDVRQGGFEPPERDPSRPLTVAVFGALSIFKGAEVVYRLAERIRRESLPLRMVLFGYTYREERLESPELVITGPYRREELPALLRKYLPEVALIPSLWPETFCYTLSEALLFGLPALVFDLGAQAERVRRSGAGIVLPPGDEEALLEALLSLQRDPERLASLRAAARAWREIPRREWNERWRELLASRECI